MNNMVFEMESENIKLEPMDDVADVVVKNEPLDDYDEGTTIHYTIPNMENLNSVIYYDINCLLSKTDKMYLN